MEYWRNHTIDFEEIPSALSAWLNYKENSLDGLELSLVEYLTMWHYNIKKGNLIDNPFPRNLRYLELTWSNINSFKGIEKFHKLKRLELHYCTKLESDSGLSEVAGTLEHLYINNSKKFTHSDEMLTLKKLRYLRLNACGNLDNLSFLNEFPNLIDFRFVDTNVLNGDLTPILEHPTLQSVGYLNKRHYNIKDTQMDELLKEKAVVKGWDVE